MPLKSARKTISISLVFLLSISFFPALVQAKNINITTLSTDTTTFAGPAIFSSDINLTGNKSFTVDSSSNSTFLLGNYYGGTGFTYGTAPTASLAVEGDVKANRLCIQEDCKAAWGDIVAAGGGGQWITTGSNIYNANSGNVGIGTTAPSNKLQVYSTGGRIVVFGDVGASTQTATPVNVSFGSTYGNGVPGSVNNLKWDLFTSSSSGSRYGIGMSSGLMEFQAGPAGGLGFFVNQGTEAMRILSSGNVGIGTTNPGAKLDVRGSTFSDNGGFYHYQNLVSMNNGTPSVVGTLKITMPKSWSSTMMTIVIKGYNYTGTTGVWEVVIGGYNYSGTSSWYNTSLEIRGKAPFNSVRLAHDGTNNVILLGTTATSWSYPKAEVTDLFVGHSNLTGWGSGWSMSFITDESSITASSVLSPVIITSTSSNVGIGTVSPGYKLDVNGTGQFNQPVIIGTPTASNHATTKSYVDSAVGGASQWATSGTNIYNTNSGNVGVGLSSPGYQLQIHNASGQSSMAITTNANLGSANTTQLLFVSDWDGTPSYSSIGQFNTGDLRFSSIGNLVFPDMTLTTAAGNLGIGTTNPVYKLEVSGTGYFSQPVIVGTPTAANQATTKSYVDSAVASAGGMPAGTTGQTLRYNSGWVADSNLYNNGTNVGIGTSNPTQKLEVFGDTPVLKITQNPGIAGGATIFLTAAGTGSDTNAATLSLYQGSLWGRTDGPGIRFGSLDKTSVWGILGSNVGVGTTNPTYKLYVNGTGYFSQPVVVGTPTASNQATTKSYVDSAVGAVASSNGQWTTSGTNIYNSNTGNVGIGTTGIFPGALAKLNIAQADGATGLAIGNTSGTGRLAINGNSDGSWTAFDYAAGSWTPGITQKSGNVGIGTTNPTVKLHVSGNQTLNIFKSTDASTSGYAEGAYENDAGGRLIMGSIGSGYTSADWTGATYIYNTGAGRDMYIKSQDRMDLFTGGTSLSNIRLSILSNGNVGIGSTDPAEKLDVAGNLNVSGVINGGADMAPNLIRNSYMNLLSGSVPAGYSSAGVSIEAVSPFTSGFEGCYRSSATAGCTAATPDDATGADAYWYGVYNKGPRIARGGMADGWHYIGDGNILKITATGLASGSHSYVSMPFERNALGTTWHFKAWVKIVKGSEVCFGSDSGYNGVGRGVCVTKAVADQSDQGWYRFNGTTSTSQITSLDGLALSLGAIPDASGDVEVYVALPYAANLNTFGTNKETWIPSVTDSLARNGLTIFPGSNNVGIGSNNPAYKLDVAGTGQFTQPVIVGTPTASTQAATKGYVDSALGGYWAMNGSDIYSSNSGNVGIGTSVPVAKLDIRGDVSFNNNVTSTAIGSVFTGGATGKTYINFPAIAGSNDPGYIMHETSAVSADSNKGVIHISPTDDNDNVGDYVTIHGTNDPETIKLYTGGNIYTPGILQITGSGNNYFSGNLGIGTSNPLAKLHVNGGMVFNRTAVADANYTVTSDDYIIGYTSISAVRTLTIPSSVCTAGKVLLVVDESGSAGGSAYINIVPQSPSTIVGQTSFALAQPYNSVPLYCNGTNWFIY